MREVQPTDIVLYFHAPGKPFSSTLIVDAIGNSNTVSGMIVRSGKYVTGVRHKDDPAITEKNVHNNGFWDWPEHKKSGQTASSADEAVQANEKAKTSAEVKASKKQQSNTSPPLIDSGGVT